ncbi:MAG: hypothetical protein HZA01_11110 [Nitrospinae bacterium]|nr:hypothetical protein [Nitrospinota bacterium]
MLSPISSSNIIPSVSQPNFPSEILKAKELYYSSTTQLYLKTSEGDLVDLSFGVQKGYSQSLSRKYSPDGSSVQEISATAKAASNYSLTVNGSLNEEEMSAINDLVGKLTPMAKDLLNKMDNGGQGTLDITNLSIPSAIEEFQFSMEEQYQAALTTTEDQPEDGQGSRIRDLPALVTSALNSVFQNIIPEAQNSYKDILDSIGKNASSSKAKQKPSATPAESRSDKIAA